MLTNAKPSGIITTVDAGIAHLVERHLGKVEEASSSLVARSSSQVTQSGGLFLFARRLTAGGWYPPLQAVFGFPSGQGDYKIANAVRHQQLITYSLLPITSQKILPFEVRVKR